MSRSFLNGVSATSLSVSGLSSLPGGIASGVISPYTGNLVIYGSPSNTSGGTILNDRLLVGIYTSLAVDPGSGGVYASGIITAATNFSQSAGAATHNSAYGAQVLKNCTSTGDYNAGLGYQAGYSNVGGIGNVYIGYGSGYYNVSGNYNIFIGYNSGNTSGLATLFGCTFLGQGATSTTDGLSNSTAIGYGATITASNQIVIGNSSVTSIVFPAAATVNANGNITCLGTIACNTITCATNTNLTIVQGQSTSQWVGIGGGSAANNSTGGAIQLYGNSHAAAGQVRIFCGAIAGSYFSVYDKNSTSQFIVNESGPQLGVPSPSTTATAGLPYLPAMSGTPTGAPTTITGMVPTVYDATKNRLWINDSGWQFCQFTSLPAIKTTTYSALVTDGILIGNSTTAFTITLPASSGSGQQITIKNVNTGIVTVAGNGTDKIDGLASQLLARWSSLTLVDYSTGFWAII